MIKKESIGDQTYLTFEIGHQVWMAENLKVKSYRNGEPIPQLKLKQEWCDLESGAYCVYENEFAHHKSYGKLYNWFSVNDPRGLAPEGWHVP